MINNTKPEFLTIAQFKAKLGIISLDVIRNPNTDKLFVSATTPTGTANFKCEQAIDSALPMRFMLAPEQANDPTQYCLINVDESKMSDANVQFRL